MLYTIYKILYLCVEIVIAIVFGSIVFSSATKLFTDKTIITETHSKLNHKKYNFLFALFASALLAIGIHYQDRLVETICMTFPRTSAILLSCPNECEQRSNKVDAANIDDLRNYIAECKNDSGPGAAAVRLTFTQKENSAYEDASDCLHFKSCVAADCISLYSNYFFNSERLINLIELANKKLATGECRRGDEFNTQASISYICGYDTDPYLNTSPMILDPKEELNQQQGADDPLGCPRVKNSYYQGRPDDCKNENKIISCDPKEMAAITLGKVEDVRPGSVRDFVTIGNELLFADTQTSINENLAGILDKQIKWLKTWQNYYIVIEGDSDDSGTIEQNIKLSATRTDLVKQYLVEHGIDQSRVSTNNLGTSHHVFMCSSDRCHARNRRVVTVLRREPDR